MCLICDIVSFCDVSLFLYIYIISFTFVGKIMATVNICNSENQHGIKFLKSYALDATCCCCSFLPEFFLWYKLA